MGESLQKRRCTVAKGVSVVVDVLVVVGAGVVEVVVVVVVVVVVGTFTSISRGRGQTLIEDIADLDLSCSLVQRCAFRQNDVLSGLALQPRLNDH